MKTAVKKQKAAPAPEAKRPTVVPSEFTAWWQRHEDCQNHGEVLTPSPLIAWKTARYRDEWEASRVPNEEVSLGLPAEMGGQLND